MASRKGFETYLHRHARVLLRTQVTQEIQPEPESAEPV